MPNVILYFGSKRKDKALRIDMNMNINIRKQDLLKFFLRHPNEYSGRICVIVRFNMIHSGRMSLNTK